MADPRTRPAARRPGPGPRVARIFDGEPGTLAPFADRPHIADLSERTRLARFLHSGQMILQTTARDPDRVEPDRGAVVPIEFRTDGQWVWGAAVAYYLVQYGIAPEPDLYAHIRRCRYRCAEPSEPAVRRALTALYARPR